MSGRSPFRRMMAVAFATLQLVSPALVVLADGVSIRDAVAESVAHVEATSSDSCPQVHAPDCALCRYLSGSTGELAPARLLRAANAGQPAPDAQRQAGACTALALPLGRAPPSA